ncbi:MAG: M15 family metallopeptidase [Rhizomicrobium sp.]
MRGPLAILTWLAALGAAAGFGAAPAGLNTKLDRLVAAYPDFLRGHDGAWLRLKDGRRLPISDGRTDKSFDAMIEHPDIDDMFFADYPAGADATAPPENFDPGRVRYAPLFDAMYGDCRTGAVAAKLRRVAWLPRHRGGDVEITTVNGVDRQLQAVIAELDALPERDMVYLIPSSGSYNCRAVAGSAAPSAHGWGIAIDLNSAAAEYWRWSGAGWHTRVPVEIARIFERHGFIWGGRWRHYDTMHFEYRPELIAPR